MKRNLCTGLVLVLLGVLLGGCPKKGAPGRPPEVRIAEAKPAVDALQATRFEEADQLASKILAADPGNPQARMVRAICRYKKTMHNFIQDMTTNLMAMFRARTLNHRYLRWSLTQLENDLAAVEDDLAVAGEEPEVFLRLCLACWHRDWNHDGRIDERDELLFQIELDADGNQIPEGDPRRKPTFRFDRGDVFWARAMVAFQRMAVNLVLAYQLPEMAVFLGVQDNSVLTIKLTEKARVLKARQLLLDGLGHADRARTEYLAEKDDEGEWVPNPGQKNHPLPLPVDDALYQTWEGVLGDLAKLIEGKEGISVVEVAQLGDHQWQDPPRGFIDISGLLTKPGDIILDIAHLDRVDGDRTRTDVENVLRDIFGDKYVPEMKATRLISRLLRMKSEVERGEESIERKLRYLFWLN
jgi:hypothetical protein